MMTLGLITSNLVAAHVIFSYFVKREVSPTVISGTVKRGRRRTFRWSHSAENCCSCELQHTVRTGLWLFAKLPPDGIIVTGESAVQIGCCAD